MADDKGSVLAGMFWMIVLSLLLFWLPGLGSLIAGAVGGKVAGSVGKALLAAMLPSIALGIGLFFLATALTGIPLVGVLAAMGGTMLALTGIGALLIGALIGGLIA